MKIKQIDNTVEMSGVETVSNFTIKSTAKSFEILSSGLYTDPITAIVRELSCNAYDSHVCANQTEVPFTIHLPNALEPYLSIRDYGTGLCDEDVLVLYTTYFDSTKTMSNDMIGALGLGSKSPFSYATGYDVVSIHDGIKSSYYMFINDTGIPDVAKMTSGPTDERNGLVVTIGIDPNDFNQFAYATAEVLRYFVVKPEVVGGTHFKFATLPDNLITGDGWELTQRRNERLFTAVQGQVPYLVNISKLPNDSLSQDQLRIIGCFSIVGYFDIGELDVAANREEVRYDADTSASIISKIEDIILSMHKQILDKCTGPTNYWEQSILMSDVSDEMLGGCALNTILDTTKLESSHPLISSVLNGQGRVHVSSTLKYHKLVAYQLSEYSHTIAQYKRVSTVTSLTPATRIIFLVNDVKSGAVGRSIQYIKASNQYSVIIMITQLPHNDDDTLIAAEYNKLINEFGNPPIEHISKSCPPVKSTNIQKRVLSSYIHEGSYYNSQCYRVNRWGKYDLDVDDGGLYYVLKGGTTMVRNYKTSDDYDSVNWAPSNVSDKLQLMVDAINASLPNDVSPFIRKDVQGIPPSSLPKIRGKENWVEIFDKFEQLIPATVDNINTNNKLKATGCYGIVAAIKQKHNRNLINNLPSHSQFKKACEKMVTDTEQMTSTTKLLELFSEFHEDSAPITPYLVRSDLSTYNLLQQQVLSEIPSSRAAFSAFMDYITLVDNSITQQP